MNNPFSTISTILPGLILCMLLALAVWHDVRSRRIPNPVVFLGALAGLILHSTLPSGAGFFSQPFGSLGFLTSLADMGVGLAILLPMYALRAMGAGDVKLMAMVGAFLGPKAILAAALWSMLAGGLLSLTVALWTRTLAQALKNIYHMMLHAVMRNMAGASTGMHIDAPPVSSAKLAYAIAIASGTVLHIFLSKPTN